MAQIVVPIANSLGTGASSTAASQRIRSALGAARTSVDQAQEALNKKRQKRLSHLLDKATFKDGFVQAQAALIQGSSVDTRGLVGSLNSPFIAEHYNARTREALESGGVSLLLTDLGFYSLEATSSSDVRVPGGGKIVSVLDNFSTECPMYSSEATPAQKNEELNRKPMCLYKKHVVVEINGLHVIYGNMDTISVSEGATVGDGDTLGKASILYFAGRKSGDTELIDNFLLYTESITPDSVPPESAVASYETSSSAPYGPHWKKIRPGGLPENVRKCSTRGAAGPLIDKYASEITSDETFKKVAKAFNQCLTSGGYISMPSTGFDIRCSVEELPLDGVECFIDNGPFPRGASFTLVSAPTRSTREAFRSNWGVFQFSMSEWRKLQAGVTFLGYSYTAQTTGTTPWEATEREELESPIALLYGVWNELEQANNLYRTLISFTALVSLDSLSALSTAISQSSADSLDAKCKDAWEELQSSEEGRATKAFIENTVIHSRTSVSSKVPEVMAGIAEDQKPDYEYKGSLGWQPSAPHSWVKFPAFAIGSGNSTKSYPFVRIGTPHQEAFSRAHQRILELGGRLTSSGGRRALSASRHNGVSMHTVGRAFDLGISTGLVVDPRSSSSDSCYLVIADDRSNIRTLYTVWAKVFPEEGDATAIEAARLDGTIIEKTFDVDLYTTRWPRVVDKRIVQWTGQAFNLTKIFADSGYVRIRPISDYYERGSYMGVEWWHYETREGLLEGVTKIEDEVQKYYTYDAAAINARTRHPNWERIKNKLWAGSYFR